MRGGCEDEERKLKSEYCPHTLASVGVVVVSSQASAQDKHMQTGGPSRVWCFIGVLAFMRPFTHDPCPMLISDALN